MRKVWKYELPTCGEFDITLPDLAKPLTVQVQRGCPVAWVEIYPGGKLRRYSFGVFMTDQEIPSEYYAFGHYLGTFQLGGGDYVAHVYWRTL
jgi:hypothetical protein